MRRLAAGWQSGEQAEKHRPKRSALPCNIMPRPVLPHVLIALGVLLLLGLIAWAGFVGRPRSDVGGRNVLFRHNAMFRSFAYVSAFGVTIGLTTLIYIYPPQGNEVWIILGLYVFFGALTLPLVWEASRFYVLVTPKGLEARSAWRGLG